MAICETQIRALVSSLEPTATQKAGAQRSQNYLREQLNTGQMGARIITSYLSGSYARDTAIYPLDDVDIIFVIEPSYWMQSPNVMLAKLLGTPLFPAPSSVLQSFASALRYRYTQSSVFTQRRSLCLQLYHLDIDVVPAIQDQKDASLIRIPNRATGEWLLTAPQRHTENATAVNKFQQQKFKPLVKLLKYWNGNLPNTAKLKSFAIETLAVRVFQKHSFASLQEGLLLFFDFIAFVAGQQTLRRWENRCEIALSWFKRTIPDAAETGGDLAAGIDEEQRKRFVDCAIRSRNKMQESFNANSIDTAYRRAFEALRVP